MALRRAIAMCLQVVVVGISLAADGASTIKLPRETAVLRPSALFGYKIARAKCGICHSADYINLQPPGMTLAQWTAEMVKMQHAYGAPLDEEEIKLLGIYLASAYGDATTVPPPGAAPPPTDAPSSPTTR
jgi:hypothetical protein